MARIRTIKPDFWTDGTIVGLSVLARLFYIGTWNFSLCDRGHLPDDPVGLKLRILPADDVDAHAVVGELLAAGRLVRRRSPDGRTYLFNPRLSDHQKVDVRWQSRCPHCASEQDGGYVEEAVSLPEPPADSPEFVETPPTSAQGSKGRDGIGEESNQHASRAAAIAGSAAREPPMSVSQRAKRITDAFAAVEPMCKWPAVNGIVMKAIKTERWSDEEIRAAVLRLAQEGRSVTIETLRVELSGLPPPNRTNGHVDVNGFKLTPETARRMTTDRDRLAAMDQLAIEGSP